MAVVVSQVSMGDENLRNLHAFFPPKEDHNQVAGEFQDRRKRQRTISPIRGPSVIRNNVPNSTLDEWESQLRVAAYGVSSNSTSELISAGQQEQKLDQVTDTLLVDNRHDSHILDPSRSDQDAAPSSEVLVRLSVPSVMDQSGSTHPKKMLTIRPDGRLASPKARSIIIDPSSRKKRARTKSQGPPRRRIVVIKYGLNDESRISIAQKIGQICSDIKEKPSSSVDADIKTLKPDGPPKSTHPFFLGAGARTLDQVANPKGISNESDTRNHQDTGTSPKKQKSPKKPSVNASAWVGLMGPPRMIDNPRTSRYLGAMEPLWPPQGMIHIRPQIDSSMEPIESVPKSSQMPHGCRKLKYAKMQISEYEDILRPYNKSANEEKNKMQKSDYQRNVTFRRPQRKTMGGSELQNIVRDVVDSILPQPNNLKQAECQNGISSRLHTSQTHIALSHVFNNIPNSLTAFDKFECETQDWAHKYAPKRAEEVLQDGQEAMILRDWLRGLAITSVDSGTSETLKKRDTSTAFKRLDGGSKRKKRKKAEDLDGFIISDEEDSDQMDELANPNAYKTDSKYSFSPKKSVIRAGHVIGQASGERAMNAVVISGPHGCGKTAAVYAVANELDFEVFEINAGSRRSGKDILDRVGDMTRNHLVNHPRGMEENENSEQPIQISESDPEIGQATMNSFFQPHADITKRNRGKLKKQRSLRKAEDITRRPKSQRQSLILLEEVDVLFEEDRQFWATILDLIKHSKRPIIMTCTDESLLPLDDMYLFAILRFYPPPERLATDYLLLVACNEGHLLSRQPVSTLLKSKRYDLRASIMDLNFFCQMAIGDTKGGLEWMLIDSPNMHQDQERKIQRVVSVNTYPECMSFLDIEQRNLDWEAVDCLPLLESNSLYTVAPTREVSFEGLERLEKGLDAVSAADIHPCSMFRHGNSALLDTTFPEISEKSRNNYVEGSTLVEAEQADDPTGLGVSITLALNSLARRLSDRNLDTTNASSLPNDTTSPNSITRTKLIAAFDPITKAPKTPFIPQKGPSISSFDGPTSTITKDLAPYIRAIVFSDIKIEEQRARLNASLSQGGLSRAGRKVRTTRASLAALEGGSKAHTRRERWFLGTTNAFFAPVLQSGGEAWQELAWQRALEEQCGEAAASSSSSSEEELRDHHPHSRRSSVAGMDELQI